MVERLKEVLAALKEAGVQQGAVKLEDLEVSVVFLPELPPDPMPGAVPVPGGWKSPTDLDAPLFQEPK